ncbi:MAG: UDP-N-acetylmuramoyl-tripeptide--D-alanyl-D-alanine ligase [Lachnospiraceae bacterium]|nr:UDP-N-acetylmuramoyl-tripeptide--D-alanyl-D-alanine ligase [Lachnospiraceae bacterium]
MKNLTLSNIAKACNGTYYGDENIKVREAAGVVIDSRNVEKDYVFIATKGERVDGHSFIGQVFEKGALCVVCEKELEQPAGPYILVEDSFQALKDIAEFYREQLDVKVVGVTGSVGKTSTKEFISSVLATKYNVLKTAGNFNNEVGLPLTVLKITDEHEVAVLEMGINHFGEMHRLSKIAKPDICVITNIGQCHLEYLKSREGILSAKTEIFDFMSEDGYVCINGDDDMLQTVLEVKGKAPITFGMDNRCDVYADCIESRGLFGSTCMIHTKQEEFEAEIPLPGIHMVMNALTATAIGGLLGLTAEEMKKGLSNVETVSGRSNIIKGDKYVIIDDCYNANPVSMKAAIDMLMSAEGRKVCILGDMGELGEDENALHEEVGAYAARAGVDCMIFVGNQAVFMDQGAEKSMAGIPDKTEKQIHHFSDKADCLSVLGDLLLPGDTVLVKASHYMGFDEIIESLK